MPDDFTLSMGNPLGLTESSFFFTDFPQKWTDRQKKWGRKDIPTDQKTTKRRKREDTIHQTNTDISLRKNISITMNIRRRNIEVNVVTAVVQTATMINRVCILSGYLR